MLFSCLPSTLLPSAPLKTFGDRVFASAQTSFRSLAVEWSLGPSPGCVFFVLLLLLLLFCCCCCCFVVVVVVLLLLLLCFLLLLLLFCCCCCCCVFCCCCCCCLLVYLSWLVEVLRFVLMFWSKYCLFSLFRLMLFLQGQAKGIHILTTYVPQIYHHYHNTKLQLVYQLKLQAHNTTHSLKTHHYRQSTWMDPKEGQEVYAHSWSLFSLILFKIFPVFHVHFTVL